MPNHLTTFWQSIDGWIRWTFLGLAAPILAIGLLYWGYCWHWWGRDSLLLQYLFQCRCPSASEATRYPHFTVLVSACRNAWIHDMSPTGRSLVVETETIPSQILFIDLRTHREQILPFDPIRVSRISSIDDQRFFIRLARNTGYVVYNQQRSSQVPISWREFDEQDAKGLDLLQQAAEVFVFDQETLVLAPNYVQHSDDNVVFRASSSAGQEQTNAQLTIAGISYKHIRPPYQPGNRPDIRYSPDGRFYALPDGIYDATTNEHLIRTSLPMFQGQGNFSPLGWMDGQRGVVYRAGTAYVVDNSNDYAVPYAWFPAPQPQLLLDLPEEFWTELEEEP